MAAAWSGGEVTDNDINSGVIGQNLEKSRGAEREGKHGKSGKADPYGIRHEHRVAGQHDRGQSEDHPDEQQQSPSHQEFEAVRGDFLTCALELLYPHARELDFMA